MFTPDPVRRPREQVEKQLRDAIISGVFKRGERLPSEATLAQEFQVARSTVREALRSLATDGLVSKSQGVGGGSFVQNIDHDSLKNLISGSLETILKIGALTLDEVTVVRSILEVPAARLAAENRTEAQVREFEVLLERQAGLLADPERDEHDPELFELGQSIYSLVGESTGNRLLGSFVSAVSRVAIGVYMRELLPEDTAKAREMTKTLVEAIIKGDAKAAERAMTKLMGQIEEHHRPSAR